MDVSQLIQTLGFPIVVALAVGYGFVQNWVVSGKTHRDQAAQCSAQLTSQANQFQAQLAEKDLVIKDARDQRDLLLQATMKNAHVADASIAALTNSRNGP